MQQDPVTIVIAGGGTAGWMAAAAFGRFLESGYRIRLIESEEIGTVGVGEATIPQIRLFNEALGLDENAFLRATGGTFKLGIEFDGWTEPGHRYMHAFGDIGRDVGLIAFQHYWLRARGLGIAKPLHAYSMNETAARAGRMHRGGPLTAAAIPPIPYAFHFDAGLYAAYLRRFAENRGVERIEGKIAEVARVENGDVAALVLESGQRIDGDLFLDCTGFRGLLIEGALETGYEDWSRWLPCDRALAVPTANVGAPLPYTRAIAREAGWQWRIPLQHRTGNGHVYCSAFTSDQAAADVLLANLEGKPLAEPRPLRFVTGRRRRAWNRNVVAMGLASGFLEPLESTSIHLIQAAVSRLLKLLPTLPVADALRDEYNRESDFEIERIRDFLILHYWANARPEPFWQACREMTLPDTLLAKIELWRDAGTIVREHEELFTEDGWLQVLAGQGVEARRHHPLADQIPAADLAEYMETLELLYRREAEALPGHADFIARNCAARQG
ncbi:tryptophan 7-halogenase [Sphingomonas sp. JC676]|uniref:tryptophan halogenase family protein n=1 Tax=Sphingomonas sp. JC676 TaxID=2768065 RepID=UPI001657859B|nr:tryptophan halogenase family protein [Sphingomonas sp. JC676]MBC9034736.1 tryptophan 7-halogenase [Sphingomonas sp. JC676]